MAPRSVAAVTFSSFVALVACAHVLQFGLPFDTPFNFIGRKEGNAVFNDALNTFDLRLYGVLHMVKDHSESDRGNLLPPHGLLFFRFAARVICTIPQRE